LKKIVHPPRDRVNERPHRGAKPCGPVTFRSAKTARRLDVGREREHICESSRALNRPALRISSGERRQRTPASAGRSRTRARFGFGWLDANRLDVAGSTPRRSLRAPRFYRRAASSRAPRRIRQERLRSAVGSRDGSGEAGASIRRDLRDHAEGSGSPRSERRSWRARIRGSCANAVPQYEQTVSSPSATLPRDERVLARSHLLSPASINLTYASASSDRA
jgi:hypothetical protein